MATNSANNPIRVLKPIFESSNWIPIIRLTMAAGFKFSRSSASKLIAHCLSRSLPMSANPLIGGRDRVEGDILDLGEYVGADLRGERFDGDQLDLAHKSSRRDSPRAKEPKRPRRSAPARGCGRA